jgi:AAA domain
MSSIFRRPDLARDMAQQLLRPSVLDEGLRSGLFLSGQRRTGKTTFLINDLIPALQDAGAIVVYVDLWSDTQTSPASLVHAAIRETLTELERPTSTVLQKLNRLRGANVSLPGFSFGFTLDDVGREGGPTLAQALTEVVDQARTDVVVIIDEVQHAIASEDGNNMLLALKSARDAINPRRDTPGHFIFVGTGSHRALISELTARRNQAFAGATSVPYPMMGPDYVDHLLSRLAAEKSTSLPSAEATNEAFAILGNRPEEMLKALRTLARTLPPRGAPDDYLAVIATTLRSSAAEIELMKVEQLGGLATAVFARIAAAEGDATGLFSTEAAADYSRSVGREVRVEETQPVVNELLAANLIMRRGHGVYAVTDPFVQEIWREQQVLEE